MIILCLYIPAIIVEMFPTNLTREAIGLGTLETFVMGGVRAGSYPKTRNSNPETLENSTMPIRHGGGAVYFFA